MNKIILALGCAIAMAGSAYAIDLPKALKDAIIADIGRGLRDPYSAQYEFVVQKQFTICGYVNAKNVMGAYVGRQPFSALYFYSNGRYDVVSNVFEPNTNMGGMCS